MIYRSTEASLGWADRPSRPRVTEQKTKALEGRRRWRGERSRGDAFSPRLLRRWEPRLEPGAPRGRRDHTPDTVVFVGAERTAALSSFSSEACSSGARLTRRMSEC